MVKRRTAGILSAGQKKSQDEFEADGWFQV